MARSDFSDYTSIVNLSRWGRGVSISALAVSAIYFLYCFSHPDRILDETVSGLRVTDMPAEEFVLAAQAVAMLPALLFVLLMWWAQKLFALIGEGAHLDAKVRRILSQLGWLSLMGSILSVVCHTVSILLFTMSNPPGRHMLTIQFSSGEIAGVIIAILLFIFSLILKEMAATDEDNKSII